MNLLLAGACAQFSARCRRQSEGPRCGGVPCFRPDTRRAAEQGSNSTGRLVDFCSCPPPCPQLSWQRRCGFWQRRSGWQRRRPHDPSLLRRVPAPLESHWVGTLGTRARAGPVAAPHVPPAQHGCWGWAQLPSHRSEAMPKPLDACFLLFSAGHRCRHERPEDRSYYGPSHPDRMPAREPKVGQMDCGCEHSEEIRILLTCATAAANEVAHKLLRLLLLVPPWRWRCRPVPSRIVCMLGGWRRRRGPHKMAAGPWWWLCPPTLARSASDRSPLWRPPPRCC